MFLSNLTEQQRETFICLAHNVVVSDGELTVGEKVMMDNMRKEMNLDPGFVAHYVPIDGMEDIFQTRRLRAIVMLSLIQLSYADGAFEIEEQCLLRDLCKLFDISEDEFALIDNWVKRLISLEREAQAFM